MKTFLKIVGAILVVSFIIGLFLPDTANEAEAETKTESTSTAENTEVPLETQLENVEKGLADYNPGDRSSIEALELEAVLFSSYYMITKDGLLSDNATNKTKAEGLKKKLSTIQAREFPKIRKKYVELARQKLWENNIEVRVSGSKNDKIILTAGMFADNGNIKMAHEKLAEMLHILRFKEAHYRWYKDQDDNYFFTLDSFADSRVSEKTYN